MVATFTVLIFIALLYFICFYKCIPVSNAYFAFFMNLIFIFMTLLTMALIFALHDANNKVKEKFPKYEQITEPIYKRVE